MRRRPVTIVIPVYSDWASLSVCIDSLQKYVDTSTHQIILVNDCGPDADSLEKNIKQAIKGLSGFEYYRNSKNLGFVGTCNRAVLQLDKTSNDVLLLNSDTKVTAGFLEEMLTVLYSSSKIGTVSPRSNNATIATVPLSAAPQKGITPEKSYKKFKKLKKKLPRSNEIPTGLGFCMLVRRETIKKYGLFDEIFGKGYGEENDFCQRIKKHGYLSVLANRAYVFHMEAKSFTLETKSKLIKQNRAIIDERYPEYTQAVRDYINEALIREEGGRLNRTLRNPRKIIGKITGIS
jgi:GT2 family glycosyltransferase